MRITDLGYGVRPRVGTSRTSSQSGKNSADIRIVVDALELCYTKEHIDTFVIISGDSDFSPLVSKLRENANTVIGLGVKNSTSDLLISNCDEFIYYDNLARALPTTRRDRKPGSRVPAAQPPTQQKDPKQDAVDLVLETTIALAAERGDTSGKAHPIGVAYQTFVGKVLVSVTGVMSVVLMATGFRMPRPLRKDLSS